jgi:hypothetical protein
VIRIKIQDGGTNCQISVSGDKPRLYASVAEFREHIVQLRIQHGDLIVLGHFPTAEGDRSAVLADWLARYCQSNAVALYLYKVDHSDSELFGIPIFNWTAPFNDPRTLSTAFFFYNGTALGGGGRGFNEMLRLISKIKYPRILVLGNLYNEDSGFGSSECPYEKQQNALDQVLKAGGIRQVIIDPLF